jgi:hypothetical protein
VPVKGTEDLNDKPGMLSPLQIVAEFPSDQTGQFGLHVKVTLIFLVQVVAFLSLTFISNVAVVPAPVPKPVKVLEACQAPPLSWYSN